MNLIEILTVILLISAISLCIALIYFYYHIVKSVQSISMNIEIILYKINPLIESTLIVSKKITSICIEAESQLQTTGTVINDVRNVVNKIMNFESIIPNLLVNAVMPYIKNTRAIGKGVGAFWSKLTGK